MLDLIIKGGTVVAPEGAGLMDVGIQGEQIAAVASPGALDDIGAAETIDATGMIVLPGGIEPHAHINVPVPDYWAGGDTGIYTQPPEAAAVLRHSEASLPTSTSPAHCLSHREPYPHPTP